jgi:hypothetical protein
MDRDVCEMGPSPFLAKSWIEWGVLSGKAFWVVPFAGALGENIRSTFCLSVLGTVCSQSEKSTSDMIWLLLSIDVGVDETMLI